MRLRLTAARRFGAVVLASLLLPAGQLLGATPPSGLWLVPDGDGVIRVDRCGGGLCGTIAGLSSASNPAAKQPVSSSGQPLCGLTILRAARETRPGVWSGTVLNPNDGTEWNCEVWAEPDGLHLRGYVLVPLLGQTQIWKAYAGRVGPHCEKTG